MLFEQLIESVLRRHHIGERPFDEQGRIIRDRLHELVNDTQECDAPSENHGSHAGKKLDEI